eukprot:NODE_148_length_17471_cov_0.413136.p13 type:complete len:141 gc:universal NODE_148_length_17471_cov_0.413136:11081-11503(+)
MQLYDGNKPITTLVVGIEKNQIKVIEHLKTYAKLRRIKRVILFIMTNKPVKKETVESPFEWYNPREYISYYNPKDYRLESILCIFKCELVFTFSKTFHLLNAPWFALAQSEIIHCSYKNVKKSIIKGDEKYQKSEQRLGK